VSIIRIAMLAAIGSLLAGCYTLQPVWEGRPEPGTRIAFEISDVGRVALGGSMGPEISQIEGRLVGSENGEHLVAVTGIRFLRGGEQIWTGERVNIKSEYVSRAYERRFSRGRTIALTATLVGGVALVVFGTDLVGLGREPSDRPSRPEEPGADLIFRRP